MISIAFDYLSFVCLLIFLFVLSMLHLSHNQINIKIAIPNEREARRKEIKIKIGREIDIEIANGTMMEVDIIPITTAIEIKRVEEIVSLAIVAVLVLLEIEIKKDLPFLITTATITTTTTAMREKNPLSPLLIQRS